MQGISEERLKMKAKRKKKIVRLLSKMPLWTNEVSRRIVVCPTVGYKLLLELEEDNIITRENIKCGPTIVLSYWKLNTKPIDKTEKVKQ